VQLCYHAGMNENPYRAPAETGPALSDYRRRICGWCAWAMLAGAVLVNIAMAFVPRRP